MQSTLGFVLFFLFLSLVVASKVSKRFKTRANRNPGSSSSGLALVDRDWFLSAKCEETDEALTKYRSIWGERETVLSELDPSIQRILCLGTGCPCVRCLILFLQLWLESFTLTSLFILRSQVFITWLLRLGVKSLQ